MEDRRPRFFTVWDAAQTIGVDYERLAEFVREGGHACAFLRRKTTLNGREEPLVSAELVERLDRRYWKTLDAFFQAPAQGEGGR